MSRILDEQLQFDGVVYKSVGRTIKLDNGEVIKRDVIVKNECVVGVVRHKSKGKFIFAKEFRVGSMSQDIGAVAGIVDDGESPVESIAREVKEEIGYTPTSIASLGYAYSSSGYSNEKINYFFVDVDGEPEGQSLDRDEYIEILEIDSEELEKMIVNNEITSNHLLACLLKIAFLEVA